MPIALATITDRLPAVTLAVGSETIKYRDDQIEVKVQMVDSTLHTPLPSAVYSSDRLLQRVGASTQVHATWRAAY